MAPSAPGTPLVSLVMIVKDEVAFLTRCLDSVDGLADEIVLVDTGSSDRTMEIARARGARVLETPWKENFAEARNVAVEAAQGEWLVSLDADEEFAPGDATRLRDLLPTLDATGVLLLLKNTDAHHVEIFPTMKVWRARPDFRFRGRIHEVVDFGEAAKAPGFFHFSDILVLHHGYDQDMVAARGKNERNLRLLELQLQERPQDAITLFYIGRVHDAEGDFKTAAEYYRRALENDSTGSFPAIRRNLAAAYDLLGEPEKSLSVARHGVKIFPDYPDLWYLLGTAQYRLGKLDEAEVSFRKAAGLGESVRRYPSMPGTADLLPWKGIAACLIETGRAPEALEFLEAVLRVDPADRVALRQLERARSGRPHS